LIRPASKYLELGAAVSWSCPVELSAPRWGCRFLFNQNLRWLGVPTGSSRTPICCGSTPTGASVPPGPDVVHQRPGRRRRGARAGLSAEGTRRKPALRRKAASLAQRH
jgi:hypothetical protein